MGNGVLEEKAANTISKGMTLKDALNAAFLVQY